MLPLLALLLSFPAQILTPILFSGPAANSGPVLKGHNKATSFAPNSTTTLSTSSLAGSTFLVGVCSWYSGGGTTSVTASDSLSNTWIGLTKQNNGNTATQIFYALSATCGAGQTFTCSGSGIYASAFVAGFSGITAYDSPNQNGFQNNGGSVTSIQPGTSGTPSSANNLVVTGLLVEPAGSISSINSGFSFDSTNPAGGTNEGGGLGWLIQAAATPQNPTWTVSTPSASATIAVFK